MKPLSTKNGQALVVLAGAMAFIITVAGVAGDVANIFNTKNKAQRAADAAAMAGLTYYLDHLDEEGVLAKANQVSHQVADLNMRKLGLPVKSKGQSINIDNAMYDHGITNMLTINTEAKTVFLQILGAKAKNISVTAVSQSVPAVVSLVLDTSNSMDDTEFQLLKNGAIDFVKQFQPKLDRIAIITFNAYAKVERPMSTFAKHQELIDIIGTNLATGIQRADGTNLAHAIERGREEIEKVAGTKAAPKINMPKNAIKAMAVFSDGAPNVMRGRFMNRLQSDTRGLNRAGWQPLASHQITTPSATPGSPAPGIDIDAVPAPYEYWYYYYYRDPRPYIVTLFTEPTDISTSNIRNPSRFVSCEQPPFDGSQYLETNWTCLEDFAYKDSRGVIHGDWIKDKIEFWCDGCIPDDSKGYRFYRSDWMRWFPNAQTFSVWRIWASQALALEEVYNSAIYEADYAKADGIAIYIIALGAEEAQWKYCPSSNLWTPDKNYNCPDTFKCKNDVTIGTISNAGCPDEYCQNRNRSFRARTGPDDRCCIDGITMSGPCPTKLCNGVLIPVGDTCVKNPVVPKCPDGSPIVPGVDCKVQCPVGGAWVNNYSECPPCWAGGPAVSGAGGCPFQCWDNSGASSPSLCPPQPGK